jgi:hypothetical protein
MQRGLMENRMGHLVIGRSVSHSLMAQSLEGCATVPGQEGAGEAGEPDRQSRRAGTMWTVLRSLLARVQQRAVARGPEADSQQAPAV